MAVNEYHEELGIIRSASYGWHPDHGVGLSLTFEVLSGVSSEWLEISKYMPLFTATRSKDVSDLIGIPVVLDVENISGSPIIQYKRPLKA